LLEIYRVTEKSYSDRHTGKQRVNSTHLCHHNRRRSHFKRKALCCEQRYINVRIQYKVKNKIYNRHYPTMAIVCFLLSMFLSASIEVDEKVLVVRDWDGSASE